MSATATLPTPSELVSELLGHAEKLNGLREKLQKDPSDEVRAEIRSVSELISVGDTMLKVAQRKAESEERQGPKAGTRAVEDENRSAGDRLVADEAYTSARGHFGARFAEVEVRTLVDSSTAAAALPKGQPKLANVRQQRLFIRDVIDVAPTTLAVVPYVQELNPATNETGATAVAEGSAKPEVVMTFQSADATIRKIAAWLPLTTEVLDDVPLLRAYVDNRLAYMLALREEAQVLNGPGTTVNLKGIRQYTIQTQSFVSAAGVVGSIGRGIGKVEAVDGYATAVVMHPTDYWTAVTTRFTDQFDGGFSTGAPFNSPSPTLWGLPVVRSRSMSSGTALVGDFQQGATLLDREQTVIRVGNQHSDYFTNNKVAVLAEERVGLAVHRPDFFCDVALS